ncbi:MULTISPECIES: hypothetical protein [unclassified Frankia]|uniref:hypothetical protein n=1 Tax=unclassified Frankia TaxID=2632575 RepID=UPI001EF61033|nr:MULTISPECIES: hypothetical protein [unclassified Frankia]
MANEQDRVLGSGGPGRRIIEKPCHPVGPRPQHNLGQVLLPTWRAPLTTTTRVSDNTSMISSTARLGT